MTRVFVPLVLLAVAVASLLVSNQLATEPTPSQPLGLATAAVPVLSAQRLPTVTAQAAPAPPPEPPPATTLERDLAALAQSAPADVCILVRQGGEDLFAIDASEPQVGASLQKLATAQAALLTLGADHTYATVALAESPPTDGVLDGDLYLLGGGDPLLASLPYAALLAEGGSGATVLDHLAADLVADGLTRIDGSVITIEDRYGQLGAGEAWPEDWIRAGAVGTLSAVALDQGYEVSEETESLSGLAPSATPAMRTAVLFDDMLEARAVVIPQRPSVAPRGGDYSDFVELGRVTSGPLGEYLRHMLTHSDNSVAELVLAEIGVATSGAGSTLDGAIGALEALAAEADRPILVFPPVDGSGLSPQNRLTCRQASDILAIGGPDGELASYLPTAGAAGTLADRFTTLTAPDRVRAKTGSLPGVSALAGFVTGSDGAPINFAVILNSEDLDERAAETFLEQMLEILLGHPQYDE